MKTKNNRPEAKSLTSNTVALDNLAFFCYYGIHPLLRFWGLGEADYRSNLWPKAKSLTSNAAVLDSLVFSHY